jgi:C2 domain
MSVQKTKKTGLSVTNVSKDHWSFGGKKAKSDGTRLVVTILRGKGLLASDTLTGKSDPISFIWCGPSELSTDVGVANDDFMDATDEKECINMGIFRTQVCPRTLEPVWNEDIVFPLSITDSYSLSHLRCIIYVRDEDIDESSNGDDRVSYDDLGMCEISVKDILMNGRVGKQSIVLVSKQLDLRSSPRMKKTAEGYIKVTCALVFDEKDTRRMFPEVAEGIGSLGEFLQIFQYQLRGMYTAVNKNESLLHRVKLQFMELNGMELNGIEMYCMLT